MESSLWLLIFTSCLKTPRNAFTHIRWEDLRNARSSSSHPTVQDGYLIEEKQQVYIPQEKVYDVNYDEESTEEEIELHVGSLV